MDYRIGKCSACGAEFKIPSSFAHDVARCKECSGVVHIEPAKGSAPGQAMPAKKVVKREQPAAPVEVQASDAEEKRKERGTLARLKAQRAAAAADAPADPEPEPEPVAAKPAAKERPARAGGAKSARPKRAAAGGRKGASGSRRRGGKDDGDEGGGRSRRGGKKEKEKKAPVGILLGALIVVGGGAAAFFLMGGEDEAPTVDAAETAAMDPTAAGAPGEPEALDAPGATDTPGASDGTEEAAAPDVTEDATPAAEEEAPKAKSPAEPIDLSLIPDFGPARGTTDEEWTRMNELMVVFLDDGAGAAGPRAGTELEEIGRKAFPVILNHMKTLDFSTEEGYVAGFACQKTLTSMLNGNNFGWKNQRDEGYVEFDKKVVRSYIQFIWDKVLIDIEAWIKAAKLDDKDPDEAARLRKLYGGDAADDDMGMDDDLGGMDDDLDVD